MWDEVARAFEDGVGGGLAVADIERGHVKSFSCEAGVIARSPLVELLLRACPEPAPGELEKSVTRASRAKQRRLRRWRGFWDGGVERSRAAAGAVR